MKRAQNVHTLPKRDATITMTIGELVAAEPALVGLANLRLAVKPAYSIAKLLGLVRKEVEFFQEKRHALVKELGVERDATPTERSNYGEQKIFAVTPENQEAFTERMKELNALEVEIAWGPIDLEALGSTHTFTAADLLLLGSLVMEPVGPKEPK